MLLALILIVCALFLAVGVFAAASRRNATRLVYLASGALSATGLLSALGYLLFAGGRAATVVVLPLGLPWIGAHFRLDALAAFFLLVINLGGAAASLYGLGYGHHEEAARRVLPFFPAFLAGMNLVVVANDAFAFLLAMEELPLRGSAVKAAEAAVAD